MVGATRAPPASRPPLPRARSRVRSRRRTRSESSPAALRVNVSPSTRSRSTRPFATRSATRAVIVSVLPEPAPATTSSGSSGASMTATCSGVGGDVPSRRAISTAPSIMSPPPGPPAAAGRTASPGTPGTGRCRTPPQRTGSPRPQPRRAARQPRRGRRRLPRRAGRAWSRSRWRSRRRPALHRRNERRRSPRRTRPPRPPPGRPRAGRAGPPRPARGLPGGGRGGRVRRGDRRRSLRRCGAGLRRDLQRDLLQARPARLGSRRRPLLGRRAARRGGGRGEPVGDDGVRQRPVPGLPGDAVLPAAAGGPGGGLMTLGAVEIARLLGTPPPTPEQVAVIEAPLEPLLVVAGAGSGKTETMTARVVHLVANGLVERDRVLGLTFTRKAAGELSDRVRRRLRALDLALGRGGREAGGALVAPTIATYNSYAAGIVAEHALRLGVEPSARLVGEAGRWQIAHDVVEHWAADLDVDLAPSTVTDAVLSLAGALAEHLVQPDAVREFVREWVGTVEALPSGGPRMPAPVRQVRDALRLRARLMDLVEEFAARKRKGDLVDFADQVALAARLARQVPDVGQAERSRYAVVLLDEYQDTSVAQLTLLRHLFGDCAGEGVGHPVTAVGDPHQSIYGWRGAGAAPAVDRLVRVPHRRDRVADALAGAVTEQVPQQGQLRHRGVLVLVQQHHRIPGALGLPDVRHLPRQPRRQGHLVGEVHQVALALAGGELLHEVHQPGPQPQGVPHLAHRRRTVR